MPALFSAALTRKVIQYHCNAGLVRRSVTPVDALQADERLALVKQE